MEQSIKLGFDTSDPDSQRLIRSFKAWVWPGFLGLAVIAVASVFLRWDWLFAVLKISAALWVALHMLRRPLSFMRDVAGAFGAGAKFMADIGAPLIARANAAWRNRRPAPDAQTEASVKTMGLSGAERPGAMEPKPKRPIEWDRIADFALNPRVWLIVAVLFVTAFVLSGCPRGGLFGWGKSGAEVAADYRANEAEAKGRTSAAEVIQRESAIVRVEENNTTRQRISREANHAREQISNAPDLESRIDAVNALDSSLRDQSARARAAALQDYHSSVDP